MIIKISVAVAAALLFLGLHPVNASNSQPVFNATTFAVVVNPANSYSGTPAEVRKLVKQLYLKSRRDWPGKGGTQAKALARAKGTDEQAALLSEILKMSATELEKHWIAVKQKTGQTRPNVVKSDTMLIKFVKKYDGALCIVKESVAKKAGKNVRVLMTFEVGTDPK